MGNLVSNADIAANQIVSPNSFDIRTAKCERAQELSPHGHPLSSNTAAQCPAAHHPIPEGFRKSGCPVQPEEEFNYTNMMPRFNQNPSPGQPFDLSKERVKSNIPKAAPDAEGDLFVYPSPQMFWNAMIRKGWRWQEADLTKPEDVDIMVHMHNFNNEVAWREVLKWEALHCNECMDPRLRRFSGDSTKISPKARLRQLMGYSLPFDRHDWIVDRCGRDVHYIVDFYDRERKSDDDVRVSFVDVRPALDSFENAWDRLHMLFRRFRYYVEDINGPETAQEIRKS